MDKLSHCFDKHPFAELNNIDISILHNALRLYFSANSSRNTDGVFFDVGTNAGSFIKALQTFGATTNIHCFEPHPVLSEKVKEVYPYVNMNKICLSNYKGMVDINIPEYSCGISSIINRPVFNTLMNDGQAVVRYSTPCDTIDNYCKDNNIEHIDFIKIDVEGAEKMVFEGACQLLKENKIKAGIFEIGQTLTDAGTSDNEVCNMIQGYGYKLVYSLSPSDVYFYLE